MNRTGVSFALAALAAVSAGAALAQRAPGQMPPGAAAEQMQAMASPGASTKAFKAADDRMTQAMDRPMSGDADRDFVAGMLPHHRGAVDMANVELRYGNDPELRHLAHAIVAAQDKEIAQMRAWRPKHP